MRQAGRHGVRESVRGTATGAATRRASATGRTVVVSALALGLLGACAGGARRGGGPAAPVVRAVADTTAIPFVNPPGTPPVSGTLRTLLALQYVDVQEGTGDSVAPRQCVYAHYTGWLPDGTKFDSSRDTTVRGMPREPIAFPLGVRRVIAGWDAGFEGMRVGGQRRLVIPFPLAYGEAGRPPVIPPRATLVFDVELLAVQDTLPPSFEAPAMPGAPPRCTPWREIAATLPSETAASRSAP
jgi:peptidylprolyl isomerase